MDNQTRLSKLKEAETLIREVEFSYPQDHPIRAAIYRVVVNTFSFMGSLDHVRNWIKDAIQAEQRVKAEQELDSD